MSLIDRADSWRTRAAELRAVAEVMHEAAARSALEMQAASLEAHATRLEDVTIKFCRLKRETARRGRRSAA